MVQRVSLRGYSAGVFPIVTVVLRENVGNHTGLGYNGEKTRRREVWEYEAAGSICSENGRDAGRGKQ